MSRWIDVFRTPRHPNRQGSPNISFCSLTSPHEWDPIVLDYDYPEDNGDPDWAIDPMKCLSLIIFFDEYGDYVIISLSILDILDDTPQISPTHNLLVNKHVFH